MLFRQSTGDASATDIVVEVPDSSCALSVASEETMRDSLNFLFLNLGHFFDHFFILIIVTVVLALGPQGGLSYDEITWSSNKP
jgi:hypothetical protein